MVKGLIDRRTVMDTFTKRSSNREFWRQMGSSGHACQIYDDSNDLVETLTSYVGGGLWAGDAAVLIAEEQRLRMLEERLRESGLDLAHFRADDRYIALSAEATLSRFLVDDWPDAGLFGQVVGEVVARARRGSRPVRAFGEMVSILWRRGNFAAAIRLEQLWSRLIEQSPLRLLCAYEKRHFERADQGSRNAVRETHAPFLA